MTPQDIKNYIDEKEKYYKEKEKYGYKFNQAEIVLKEIKSMLDQLDDKESE